MAEFTELFPLGQQFDGWVHTYVYVITFDPPTVIIICIMITLFFFIFYRILNGLLFWFTQTRSNEHDLEEGTNNHLAYGASESSRQVTVSDALVHSNLQAWTVMTAFGGVFYEKRGQMLRALKKLPPLVSYGEHDVTRSYVDCAICLENFEVGQYCQVFPVCNHFFHSNCIDHWLQKKLTCPICRSCL